ncbi:hypothetical protein ACFQV2_37450 [Actinokineospora soli]|uniref:Uncharacterized protein n=1 Tax=Actinokineospora soli TaxID=1048753 RepID=A0ABW2TXN5_9PSEU
MISLDQPRPPGSAALLVRVGGDHGAPAEACLAGTGITAEQLADPEHAVPRASNSGSSATCGPRCPTTSRWAWKRAASTT